MSKYTIKTVLESNYADWL